MGGGGGGKGGGSAQFFTDSGKKYNFSFFFVCVEKESSDVWEMCPKILVGYEYQNPLIGDPKGMGGEKEGTCVIDVIFVVNLNFLEKYIKNQ